MNRALLLGSGFALALAATACKDQPTAPAQPALRSAGDASLSTAVPAGVTLSRSAVSGTSHARIVDRYSNALTQRAIDPNSYVCQESTPITDWYVGAVLNFVHQEPGLFDILYNQLLADQIPTYEAYFFETTATPQTFGYTGEFTKTLQKTERDVKNFWDIQSAGIQMVAMHGTILQNTQATSATYQLLFGLPANVGNSIASTVRSAVLASHVLNGGNHPLFTFNSFAISTDDGSIPDKIVMGDGILEGYAAIGFGDVAPQAIFAHEFGHHIQFQRGYFGDHYATTGSAAEQTQYTELMADAFAGYYLTHKRGGTMNRKRVEQFLQVFFGIGDCGFADAGHHGTPNQRMAAARFGFDVADQAQKQGHILTGAQFHDLFVAQYPTIIAPDAP